MFFTAEAGLEIVNFDSFRITLLELNSCLPNDMLLTGWDR